MYNNSYGNLLLFGITSLLGIWMCYELSVSLSNNQVLQWSGKNSIIIYVFHARVLNVLHGIGKTVPSLAKSNYLYPANWHYFLITMFVLAPIVFFCNRRLPFLFGRSKSKQA